MQSYQSVPEISVEELAQRLAEPDESLQFIDVREPSEVEMASLDGFEVLPLSQSNLWADEITTRFDPNAETIVMCHHGVRSWQMCQWLLQQGFQKVKNVSGGIDAYSLQVDPSVPRY